MHVFKPAAWNPAVLTCPTDLDPVEEHSYVLNSHLAEHGIKFSTKITGHTSVGLSNSDVIVMGEKVTDQPDYYMDGDSPTNPQGDFARVVEPYRHGPKLGSNYLFLDLHVGSVYKKPNVMLAGIDPWDPQAQ